MWLIDLSSVLEGGPAAAAARTVHWEGPEPSASRAAGVVESGKCPVRAPATRCGQDRRQQPGWTSPGTAASQSPGGSAAGSDAPLGGVPGGLRPGGRQVELGVLGVAQQ